MYKCKECGAEYEEKPDYCDCGNDEFIQTEEQKQPVPEPKKKVAAEIIPDKNVTEEKPKPQPAASFSNQTFTPPPKKKTFSEQYPGLSRMISSVDPISFSFFSICCLLALYIIFFAWNPNPIENTNTQKLEVAEQKNIPSIDKFWNDALPVVKKEEPKKEEIVENIIKQVVPVQTPKKSEPSKTVTTKPKVATVPLKKVSSTQKKSVTTPKQTTKTTTVPTSQEQAKAAADAAAKQKAEQERKAAEAAQLKKLQAEQAKKAEAEKARQAAAAKQEYANYKAQLRNTIGRKIDFTRVIGDGSCIVAFKIDSSGRLINRSFAQQSSNNTLNDAVYAAIMATPSFKPPPSAYKNETLNLNIRFYNGNFEISLP